MGGRLVPWIPRPKLSPKWDGVHGAPGDAHLHSGVSGVCRGPSFVSGRLYLHVDPHLDDQEATFSVGIARRILVLSLQGDILQEFTHPSDDHAVEFLSICYFDHKLLVSFYEETYADGDPNYSYGMLALQDRYRSRL